MTAALGGHAAETIVFGEMSTGAGDDIVRATAIVSKMVKECGMSERLGPVAFGRKQQMVFLGRDIGEHKDYSDRVGEVIDDEIRRLIAEAYARATAILQQHRALLDRLADIVRARLNMDRENLPLAKILQGGTWTAGRAIARQLRPDGGPPLKIVSDGTVF